MNAVEAGPVSSLPTTTRGGLSSRTPRCDLTALWATAPYPYAWSALDIIEYYDRGDLDADACLWCVLHESLIPARTLHLLACDFAEAALRAARRAGREPTSDSWDAARAKRGWVDGEVESARLEAAEKAAIAVAWEAKDELSLAAASAAAGAADKSAAPAAENAASWAVWAAAREAEVSLSAAFGGVPPWPAEGEAWGASDAWFDARRALSRASREASEAAKERQIRLVRRALLEMTAPPGAKTCPTP